MLTLPEANARIAVLGMGEWTKKKEKSQGNLGNLILDVDCVKLCNDHSSSQFQLGYKILP